MPLYFNIIKNDMCTHELYAELRKMGAKLKKQIPIDAG